ncbi:MAG: hypothetical protein ACK4SA_02065 [Caldilinea sp.]
MDAFLSFHAPGFWLVMALLAGVIVVGVRPFASQSAQTLSIPIYWVMLPYLALISGGVSPRLMGLLYIDWVVSLRIGVGLTMALIALALGMRAVATMAPADATKSDGQHSKQPLWSATLIVVGLCGAEEFFWAFLRGASMELLTVSQFSVDVPAYWAVWIAVILAAPTALLNTSGTYSRLVKATILFMSSIVFFYTRNFWLCWALHAAVWMLFRQPMQHQPILDRLAPSPANHASATGKNRSR